MSHEDDWNDVELPSEDEAPAKNPRNGPGRGTSDVTGGSTIAAKTLAGGGSEGFLREEVSDGHAGEESWNRPERSRKRSPGTSEPITGGTIVAKTVVGPNGTQTGVDDDSKSSSRRS